jgi:hypothetical protein
MEKSVLDHVDTDESVSSKLVGKGLNLPHMTNWRLLDKQLHSPYLLQWLHGLTPADFQAWENVFLMFCSSNCGNSFISSVLIWEEAHFIKDGIINIHNQHQLAEENPHGVIHSRQEQHFSINVWTEIVFVLLLCYGQPLPRFPLMWSARTTGSCTIGSQSMNMVHAWWCSGLF